MPKMDLFPASYAQQRLWFLDNLYSNTNMFNIPFGWLVEGQLNQEFLRKALNQIIHRHEALRTRFVERKGVLFQEIMPEPVLSFELLNAPTIGDSYIISKSMLGSMAKEPFDLQSGPLFRAVLVEHSKFQHSLLFVVHHIIFDGWSINLLVEEIDTFYGAFEKGLVNPLADLPFQYADFAVWQRNWLVGDIIDRQVTYWKNKLKNLTTVLDLPFNKSPVALSNHSADSVSIVFEAEVVRSLRKVSQINQVTTFIFLISVFAILLSRYSHQNDICIGYPVSNRNHTELEKVIGFFVNTLPLRICLDEVITFEDLLKRVRERVFEASEYQDVPFEKIVEILHPYREVNRAPLFQALFTLDSVVPKGKQNSSLKMVPLLASSTADAQLDLSLSLTEAIDSLILGAIEYKSDLFVKSTIEKMVEHFIFLVKSVIANPQHKIKYLQLLTDIEQQEILIDWNNTQKEYVKDKSICELFEEQVNQTPDAIAVIFEERQITYKELNSKANQLAHYLIKKGVKADTLVAIYTSRSIEMVIGVLSVLKAGGAYVPIDIEYPIERLTYILKDTATQIVLTQSILLDQLPQENTQVISLDQSWDEIQKLSTMNPRQSCYLDNLAYCIFTSGSTGKPKGTLNTHRGFTNLVQWYASEITRDITPIRMLLVSSFGFDLTQKNIMGTLINGGSIIIPQGSTIDLELLSKTALRHCPTHVNCAPSAYLVYKDILINSSIHTVILGGEEINSKLMEIFQQEEINLINSYGPTECADVATYYKLKSDLSTSTPPIGRPISNVQIYILDSNLMPVPVGVTGELYISGVGLGRGYLNKPDLTAEKFIPNPYGVPGSRMYKTGDLARYLLNGSIEFEGRVDQQIKFRGFRIELGEIESALQEVSAIQRAVVLMTGDELDRKLIAYIVARSGVSLKIMELRSYLQKTLPKYMIPSDWVFIDDFPLNPNGKIDRKALSELKVSKDWIDTEYVAPRNPTEEILVEVWTEVLKVERVGIYDNFFALGGHSLLATQVISRVGERLGKKISLRLFLNSPTLEVFAEKIDQLSFLRDEQKVTSGLIGRIRKPKV